MAKKATLDLEIRTHGTERLQAIERIYESTAALIETVRVANAQIAALATTLDDLKQDYPELEEEND